MSGKVIGYGNHQHFVTGFGMVVEAFKDNLGSEVGFQNPNRGHRFAEGTAAVYDFLEGVVSDTSAGEVEGNKHGVHF